MRPRALVLFPSFDFGVRLVYSPLNSRYGFAGAYALFRREKMSKFYSASLEVDAAPSPLGSMSPPTSLPFRTCKILHAIFPYAFKVICTLLHYKIMQYQARETYGGRRLPRRRASIRLRFGALRSFRHCLSRRAYPQPYLVKPLQQKS